MTETKHTEAWEVFDWGDELLVGIPNPDTGWPSGHIFARFDLWDDESEDNARSWELARLIAAAPEMAKMLQRVLDAKPAMLDWVWNPDDGELDLSKGWGDAIRELLAKARGEAKGMDEEGTVDGFTDIRDYDRGEARR